MEDEVDSFPTPLAESLQAIYECRTDKASQQAAAVRFGQVAMGMLHAMPTAVLGEGVGVDQPPALRPTWRWGCPQRVYRLWERLNFHLPAKSRMDLCMEPESSPLCVGVFPPPHHFLEVLDDLACGRVSFTGSNWELWLSALLGRLCFLRYWSLFTPVSNQLPNSQILIFRGLRTHQKPSSQRGASGLELGRLFATPHHGKIVIHLEPFSLLVWDKGGRPDPQVLVTLGEGSAAYQSSRSGLAIPSNDRAPDLWKTLRLQSTSDSGSAGAVWGMLSLHIPGFSALNKDYGYPVVDRILLALDAVAAQVAAGGHGAMLDPIAVYPFFREADRLLIPFRYAETYRSEIESIVERLASHLVAAAFQAAKDAGISVRENVLDKTQKTAAFTLQVAWTLSVSASPNDLPETLMAEAEIQNRNLRKAVPETPVIFLSRHKQTEPFQEKMEVAFTRVSEAAQAVVIRENPQGGPEEWLLRYNRNHGCFSPIGGHCEWIDLNDPRRTLLREIREEVGLELPPEALVTLNKGAPIIFTEFSKAKDAHTRYFWHVFQVDLPKTSEIENMTSAEHLQWWPVNSMMGNPQVSSLIQEHMIEKLKNENTLKQASHLFSVLGNSPPDL